MGIFLFISLLYLFYYSIKCIPFNQFLRNIAMKQNVCLTSLPYKIKKYDYYVDIYKTGYSKKIISLIIYFQEVNRKIKLRYLLDGTLVYDNYDRREIRTQMKKVLKSLLEKPLTIRYEVKSKIILNSNHKFKISLR